MRLGEREEAALMEGCVEKDWAEVRVPNMPLGVEVIEGEGVLEGERVGKLD